MSLRNRIVRKSRLLPDLFAPPAPSTLIFGEPTVVGDRMLIPVHETSEPCGDSPQRRRALGSIEITPTSSDFYPIEERRRWVTFSLLLLIVLATVAVRMARH